MMIKLYKKTITGRSKTGLISKVVRLSGWSHSKVPLYFLFEQGVYDSLWYMEISSLHQNISSLYRSCL